MINSDFSCFLTFFLYKNTEIVSRGHHLGALRAGCGPGLLYSVVRYNFKLQQIKCFSINI
jgi:hypothetical protein